MPRVVTASLTHGPKVLDDFILFSVPSIVCMFLPVVDIDIRDTTNKQFEFPFVKNVNKVRGNQFVEPSNESVELLFNSFLDPPFGDKTTNVS